MDTGTVQHPSARLLELLAHRAAAHRLALALLVRGKPDYRGD